VTEEEWREEAQRELSGDQQLPRSVLDDPRNWAKPPSTPSDVDSVMMGLRALRPGGTAFTIRTELFFPSPSGPLFQAFLDPLLWVFAQVRPTLGDPDLRLTGVTGGTAVGVFNSALPDGGWDMVYGLISPLGAGFHPTIRVIPFATPIVTSFIITGWWA
jgi:hypothetical protein